MNENRAIYREILFLAVGEAVCVAAMLGVFALLHAFDWRVLVGGLFGGVLAVGNFFLTAVSVTVASKKAAEQDVRGGQATMRASMTGRQILLIILLIAGAASGYTHPVALVVPLLFVRPIIAVGEFFRKSGDGTP